MTKTEERPPGGHQFEAVRVEPYGWLCLTPWIQTPDGHWWRAHIEGYGSGDKAREWADHLAAQINEAMKPLKADYRMALVMAIQRCSAAGRNASAEDLRDELRKADDKAMNDAENAVTRRHRALPGGDGAGRQVR